MTNGIRAVIEMKNNAYEGYIMSGMIHNIYISRENLTTELSNLIRDTKIEYYSSYSITLAAKLANPSTSAKTYWSILKTFSNGGKVPVILPFLILRLKLIISTDALSNNVQQFPRIAPYLPLFIL